MEKGTDSFPFTLLKTPSPNDFNNTPISSRQHQPCFKSKQQLKGIHKRKIQLLTSIGDDEFLK
jgi:hypothetical protein